MLLIWALKLACESFNHSSAQLSRSRSPAIYCNYKVCCHGYTRRLTRPTGAGVFQWTLCLEYNRICTVFWFRALIFKVFGHPLAHLVYLCGASIVCCLAYLLSCQLSTSVFSGVCHCLPAFLSIPAARPLLQLIYIYIFFLLLLLWLFVFTCDPARRLSVASPPLQEKEVVTPLRHPELQGVFQQNFLRVQPHIFQQGGTGGIPPPSRSLQGGVCEISFAGPPARERPDRTYSGGFSGLPMIVLRSRQLQASDFLASSDPSRPICSSCTHGVRSSI